MSADVDAVIAALRAVMVDAEKRVTQEAFYPEAMNRWIDLLPGAWLGRWTNLKISGNYLDEVARDDFLAHLRATLAYLEVNRDSIGAASPWLWPFKTRRRATPTQPGKPLDAEFSDVPPADMRRKPVRLLKSD